MNHESVRKVAVGGVLAAIILVLTMLVSIPMPGGHGYINLGDAGVLITALVLGGPWGALVAGTASALADVLLGWSVYAPATLLIKSTTSLLAWLLLRVIHQKWEGLAFFVSALVVPIGYCLYEWMLYGLPTALTNVPLNLVQCLTGAAVAQALLLIIRKTKIGGQL